MKLAHIRKADRYIGYLLIILLLLPVRLFALLLRRNHSLSRPPQNILCIKIMGLGSLILAEHSIAAIRKRYPAAHLILLTDPNIAAAVRPFKMADEYWTIRSNKLHYLLIDSFRCLIKSWRCKALWTVDLEVYSKLSPLFSLCTLAINRFGFYLSSVRFRRFLNTHHTVFDQDTFLGENYIKLAAEVAGTQIAAPEFPTARSATGNCIAINNTCSALAPQRKLDTEQVVAICRWILENTECEVALLGAPEDVRELQGIRRQIGSPDDLKKVRTVTAFSDFDSYYAFLSSCLCLVTIDSGPLHLAHRFGVPTLSIWGPTNPRHYLPAVEEGLQKDLCIYSAVSCSPCVHRTEKLPCGGNNFCMKEIDVLQIVRKLESLLVRLEVGQGEHT